MPVYRRRSGHESEKHKTTVVHSGSIDDLWFSRWNGLASGTQTDIRGYGIPAKQIQYSPERICKNHSDCSRLSSRRTDELEFLDFFFCFQMWNGTLEKIRQHYYVTPPNVNRFVDVNNNNDDPYSMVEREMSNVISVQSKNDFELKEPYYFNVRPQTVLIITTDCTIL